MFFELGESILESLELQVLFLLVNFLALVLEFQSVQLYDKVRVLFCLLFNVFFGAILILHGCQLLLTDVGLCGFQDFVEVFDHFWVPLLCHVLRRRLGIDVLLIKFHHADHISFIVFGADNFVDILCEFQTNGLLVIRFLLLLGKVFI